MDHFRHITGRVGKYDDAYVDAVPTTRGPRWLRRWLAIPRCTNSLSLYLFFLVDALVFVSALKIARFVLKKAAEGSTGEEWWVKKRETLARICAFVPTFLLVFVFFKLLHRKWTWIDEPHTLLTVTITLYLFAYTYLDSIIADP